MNKDTLSSLRKQYPAGTRIGLLKMDDPQAPPVGTKGTVEGVDDIGNIMMRWDNGSGLNLVPGVDEYKIVSTTTMTINEGMRKYRLPNPTTPEDLECRWSKLLTYGDKIIIAGHYWNGSGKPCYFGAVYEHLDGDLSCEGTIGLAAVSNVEFFDDGHAIAWAMQQ